MKTTISVLAIFLIPALIFVTALQQISAQTKTELAVELTASPTQDATPPIPEKEERPSLEIRFFNGAKLTDRAEFYCMYRADLNVIGCFPLEMLPEAKPRTRTEGDPIGFPPWLQKNILHYISL